LSGPPGSPLHPARAGNAQAVAGPVRGSRRRRARPTTNGAKRRRTATLRSARTKNLKGGGTAATSWLLLTNGYRKGPAWSHASGRPPRSCRTGRHDGTNGVATGSANGGQGSQLCQAKERRKAPLRECRTSLTILTSHTSLFSPSTSRSSQAPLPSCAHLAGHRWPSLPQLARSRAGAGGCPSANLPY
jgi:hypothetical protein